MKSLSSLIPLRRTASLALLSAALILNACAAPPKPRVLQEANDRIQSSETVEIEDLQPRLMREAKQYEIQARQAYERRDLEEAKLYAHLAIQRYDTARNLVQRDAAEQLSVLMAEANVELSKEEEQLAAEQRELARYSELQSRFNDVQGELSQVREDLQGEAAQARRLLLQARSRQAEALGAGASMIEPESYAQARLEVENALEAYDSELYQESSAASQRAIAAFDQLVEIAQNSAKARRQQEQDRLAKMEERNAQLGELQQRAQAALDEATSAQTTAIGARMPQQKQALYEQAVFLLESAERRFRDRDFDGSIRKSNDARDIFLSASKDANVASEDVMLAAGASQQGGAAQPASSQAQEATAAIERAEDARGAALARGALLSEMQRGDYSLELARQARERQEYGRAVQKASEASALYEGLGAPVQQAAALAPASGAGGASGLSSSSKGLRDLAEQQIVKLQLERAEALGALKDEECPGSFREFEAVLELAQQRYDAKDYAQAFEFSVRASERLNQCDVVATSASSATASSAPSKPSAEERADAKARDEAATALSLAQGDYAVLEAKLKPGDQRLKEPAILIAMSERWFNQRDYAQAEALAKRASESMEALKLSLASATSKTASATPAKKEATSSSTPAKSAEELAKEARLQEVCRQVDGLVEQAKGAQLRASSAELDDAAEARYRRAIRSLNRAQDLRKEESCEAGLILAEEAQASFDELARESSKEQAVTSTTPPVTTTSPVQSKTTPKTTTPATSQADKQLQEQRAADATSAIAGAKLARAQVESQSKNNVYTTANSLLKEAERAFASAEYPRAEGLATQAAGAFRSLDANAAPITTASGETIDPSWKPAYSKVLDALIRRDEVKSAIGKPEEETFDRGVQNLERSRNSWDARDYMAAGRFADAAKADFDKAATAAKTRAADEERQRQEQIARESEAEKQKRLAQEREAAEAKAQAEKEAAAKARADQEAKTRAEQDAVVTSRRSADDVIREATIKKDLCDKERCSLRDETSLVRANATLDDAQKAFDIKDFTRAEELARAALTTYETILQKPRKFALPSDVSRVSLAGDRLILNPKVKFESGTTVIVAESLPSLDELAKVLRENATTLGAVKLVGYTDSRGNDAKNLTLSEERAAAVKKALIDRGVDRDLLSSEGRGEADPVATNKTADGRELNRRVEVIVTIK